MTPLAPRTLTALRSTRSCFGVDPLASAPSSPFGFAFRRPSVAGTDLGSYLFFLGLIAATFLV